MLIIQDKKGNKVIEVFDNRHDASVLHISNHLRDADFDEVFAATGESPHLSVLQGWKAALRRFIIFDYNGCACAVIGIRPKEAFSDICVIWGLGTDGLDKISKFFLYISKPMIKELLSCCSLLYNYVDARYEKAISWLKWCGFTVADEPIPFGASQLPFYEFYMEAI